MVDERRLRRLLQGVTDNLAFLRERAALPRSSVRGDPDRLAATKYAFVITIEGCINAAQHLAASEGWGPPESNADAIRLLGQHHVVSTDVAGAVAGAAGFRNILVHGYAAVDDDMVVAFLDRLDDLAAFVAGVSSWADDHGPTDPGG